MINQNVQLIEEILADFSIEHFGLTPMQPPLTLDFYKTWIDSGHHGEMEYLKRHLKQKEDPNLLLKNVNSAIVIAFPYLSHPYPAHDSPVQNLNVAKYAQGEDYHDWVIHKLDQIIDKLKINFPGEFFLSATDSKPILERDLAYRAGLGWFGKNTCLIDQKRGSFFLIGEILTTIKIDTVQNLHPDRCGTCTKCIDLCPTEAIIAPHKLDARKCISYLTIELKGIPEEKIRNKIGDHFFGCDICQSVCPWNQKLIAQNEMKNIMLQKDDMPTKLAAMINELRMILIASNENLEQQFSGTPLSRAKGFGLKRNAIIVATNLRLKELIPEISFYANDPKLNELVAWSLENISLN